MANFGKHCLAINRVEGIGEVQQEGPSLIGGAVHEVGHRVDDGFTASFDIDSQLIVRDPEQRGQRTGLPGPDIWIPGGGGPPLQQLGEDRHSFSYRQVKRHHRNGGG